MSENNYRAPPTFVDRTDPVARAEGLMRVVDSILTDPELSEEARRDLQDNEIVQRLRLALGQNG